MATLTKCYATFGVPGWATSEEWDGNNILTVTVSFSLLHPPRPSPREKWKVTGEHRNTSINPGNLVHIQIPFGQDVMDQIKHDEIKNIFWTPIAHPGEGNPNNHSCRYRLEIVLVFSDGKIMATGSNDPAHVIFNDRRAHYDYQCEVNTTHSAPTLVFPVN